MPARWLLGGAVLAVSAAYLTGVVDLAVLAQTAAQLAAAPVTIGAALLAYAAAFALRAWSWRLTLPGLPLGQSWAALHVSLLGNHLLPLRLGEPLRVTSVLRRTDLPARAVLASAVTARGADVLAVLLLALLAAPALVRELAGGWAIAAAGGVAAAVAAGVGWSVRLRRQGVPVRLPGPRVALAAAAAWALESTMVWAVARTAGHPLAPAEAVAVTAATIAVQLVAVTPGGFGSYEAAATAALVAAGVPAGPAFAVALSTHAVKTGYAVLVGLVALAAPAPAYWGRLRLPRRLPPRPARAPVPPEAPVVAIIPAHNEEPVVAAVVSGLPARVAGRRVVPLVIDDGSTDATALRAAAAGAEVIRQHPNQGLGAAVRRGLAEATTRRPAAVVYLDADGEYAPGEVGRLLAPVLSGAADYVVGSRFAGRIDRMLPHRRLGNRLLTVAVRWLTRRRDLTDGQSGFRAFSAEAVAAAEIIHDYNYAQVLTLDLLAKGFRYAEVPIGYRFRTSGRSFVRIGRYLRRVVPAVYRELNPGLAGPTGRRCGGAATNRGTALGAVAGAPAAVSPPRRG
jgi:uncharacterized membrane protein YbhN (UPF0104 family)